MTKNRRTASSKINKAMVSDEFGTKISRLTESCAYLEFCEEVYGYRAYLFNMMDKEQLDFVMNSIPVSSEDTVVDLGCGAGSLLNLLTEKYSCHGIGIDRLDCDIVERCGNAITYINGDIDRISDYNIKPTITLSVDSLYFGSDLDNLIRQLAIIKNNRMYFFYSQYLFDETSGDRSVLQSENTKVAEVLKKNGISFRTVDYSENERLLYAASLKTLQKYRNFFALEGNTDLLEQKQREDTLGANLYDKGLARRYLYIIEK